MINLLKPAARQTGAIFAVVIVCVAFSDAGAQSEPEGCEGDSLYIKYSKYTDPGPYAYLYDAIMFGENGDPDRSQDLQTSLQRLCELIKRQLIHPFDKAKFAGQIPEGREYEDMEYPTVEAMLRELLDRRGSGLVMERKPSERLVVACVHHCMLLSSILRHHGIPARMRSGYATYIGRGSGLRVTHAVVEVWDGKSGKWILVDPDRNRVDFPRSEFEFASQTWDLLRSGSLEHEYFVRRYGTVERATVHLLVHDLSYLTGGEEPYYHEPPIVDLMPDDLEDLPEESLRLIDRLALLLKDPDQHIEELARIQAETADLQCGDGVGEGP